MAFQPFHTLRNWLNLPSQKTAINAMSLNYMDQGIKEADNRIVHLDANKADKSQINALVKDVSLDSNTGILTVTLQNGTTKAYDLDIEKVVTNFDINDDNELVLTLADGTQKVIDLTRFIYSVDSTSTIAMQIQDRTITARIVDGSVTMNKLDVAIQTEFRQYMLDAQSARDAALQYQKFAKRYTQGDSEFPGSETDNAKFYYGQVKADAATSGQNAQLAVDAKETAIEQAIIARQKATNASASETNAAASAQIATQKAASASASEQVAKDKADVSTVAATTATQKATAAAGSEANAKTYRDQTENIANEAVTDIVAAGGMVDKTLTDFNTKLLSGYFNGPTGPQGGKGDKGDKGDKGEKGDTGKMGLQGPTGATGATGSQGSKGDSGAQGPQGIQGIQGPQGQQGERGSDAVVTQANGTYAFQVRSGHLFVLYPDSSGDPPPVSINEAGHFIVRLGG